MKITEMKYRCCICGKKFSGYGNNPYPVNININERCCDECNEEVVIPMRIERLEEMNKKK